MSVKSLPVLDPDEHPGMLVSSCGWTLDLKSLFQESNLFCPAAGLLHIQGNMDFSEYLQSAEVMVSLPKLEQPDNAQLRHCAYRFAGTDLVSPKIKLIIPYKPSAATYKYHACYAWCIAGRLGQIYFDDKKSTLTPASFQNHRMQQTGWMYATAKLLSACMISIHGQYRHWIED